MFNEPSIMLHYIISLLVQVSQVLASIALFFIISTATSVTKNWFVLPDASTVKSFCSDFTLSPRVSHMPYQMFDTEQSFYLIYRDKY